MPPSGGDRQGGVTKMAHYGAAINQLSSSSRRGGQGADVETSSNIQIFHVPLDSNVASSSVQKRKTIGTSRGAVASNLLSVSLRAKRRPQKSHL